MLLGILSGLGLCVVLKGEVFLAFYPWLLCVFYLLECKDGFYTVFGVVAFEVEVLLGVGGFVVDICDDLAIYSFYKDV